MTVHLVYSHQNKISSPDVIGYVLSRALSSFGPVITYEWDSVGKIVPNPGDILIGHPHPFPFTIFRRSLANSNWSKIIILQPFNLDIRQVGYIDSFIDKCDRFLAITGNYWFDRIDQSCLSRWSPKMVHIDLAVDRNSFPRIKKTFNIPGERRFIYIGNDNPVKNLSFLSKIAQALPEYCFSWAGKGTDCVGLQRLGYIDFSSKSGKELISRYDFMITVGTADANPTTILEAMSWGLVPVCTPTSGYENIPGIVNVSANDLEGTISVLRQLQKAPEEELLYLVARADEMLITHFNWDRFCGQVSNALMSDDSPILPLLPTVCSVGQVNSGSCFGGYKMFGQVFLNNLKYWLKIK
jgi:glycosyltransferase involved in cell wall biosynthesis